MLLIVLILLLGLIGLSLPAQNPDLYSVNICVKKVATKTQITWYTPPALADATCEIGFWPKNDQGPLESLIDQSSNGSFIRDISVLYVVRVTCELKGMSQDYSQQMTFLPDNITSDKPLCSHQSQQADADNSGVHLCSWQAASRDPYPYSLLWWWPTRPNISTCDIIYIDEKSNKHRTVENVSANLTVHIPASEAWAECKDDLNRIHRSQRVKLRLGFSSTECKFNAVWQSTGHPTILPTDSPPVRFKGFNVSSIGKGLVLAFAVIFITVGIAVFIHRRYKWFRHRRAQRLLRVEDPDPQEELTSMEEFQRMI